MEQGKQIQWFPGHMTRTRRKMQECLTQVDIVAEIRDARIPMSSKNPELEALVGSKPRLILLNKADLADPTATSKWVAWLKKQGVAAITVDAKSGKGINDFLPGIREILQDRIAEWKAKGMVNRPVRVMVIGIPNVGKSSFINRLTKGGKAKVEDRPGVTRQNQWFVIGGGAQLLDTPGVLWPKFEDQTVAKRLAFTGAIKDQVVDCEELACEFLKLMEAQYRELLKQRYKLTDDCFVGDSWELLQSIGRKRGMLVSGGEVNTERAASMLLDEYRAGKLGRLSLEWPEGGRTNDAE